MENQIKNRIDMRTLSPQEIAQIDQRLESLKINYLEIYHELRDHYFSELEKKSEVEFESSFQQLNASFDWKVVKRMEKSLERTTKSQITSMQWEQLKFWKLSNPDWYLTPLVLLLILIVYVLSDVEGMCLMVGVVSIIGIAITWFSVRDDFTFSLRNFTVRSKKVLSREILMKSGFFFGGIYWFYVAESNWNNPNSGIAGTIVAWIFVIPIIFYMVTFIKIALRWKQKKSQAIAQ
jgi:hypothetical protein